MNDIRQTLRVNLCVGCGVCAAACGAKAIAMRWRDGKPVPSINRSKCAKCGLCAKVCVHTPERMRREAEKIAAEQDPGAVGLTDADLFLAWDNDNAARRKSASGGVITRLALELLRLGRVDGVIHVKRVLSKHGESKFHVVLSRTAAEVEEGRSSAYQAVDFSEALSSLEHGGTYFLTGTPCVISGVKALGAYSPSFRDIKFITCALICSHNVTARFADWIGDMHRMPKNLPWAINMRDKENEPDANHFNTHVYSAERTLFRENRFRSGWTDAWRSYMFAINVCCYCSDFWGRDADISVKDAWGKWAEDPLGKSIVIIRSGELKSLWPSLPICSEMLDFQTVLDCQPIEVNFKQHEALNKWTCRAGAQQNRQNGFFAKSTMAKLSHSLYRLLPFQLARRLLECKAKQLGLVAESTTTVAGKRNLAFVSGIFSNLVQSISTIFHYCHEFDPAHRKLILVAGGYGYGNVGDEAQCNATLKLLSKRFPEYQVENLTPRPDYSHGEHPGFSHDFASRALLFNQFFPNDCYTLRCGAERLWFWLASKLALLNAYLVRADLPTIFINARKALFLQKLKSSSMFFFCGGGYLTGATESRLLDGLLICRLCSIFNVPVVMSGQTLGLWRGRRQRALARRCLRNVSLITLRDETFSQVELEKVGISGPHVFPTHDDALFCDKATERQVASQKYIVLNFHYWGMDAVNAQLCLAKLRRLIGWLIGNTDYDLVFLPMHESDRQSYSDYIARHPSARFSCYDYDFDFRKARRVIADAEFCITMKHHPIIFAMGEDVPVVSLAFSDYYVHKNLGALLQYGQEECSVNFADADWFDHFLKVFDLIDGHRSEVVSAIRERKAILAERKEKFLRGVTRILHKETIPVDRLHTNGRRRCNGLLLARGQIQFGPYISLSAGCYEASVFCNRPSAIDVHVTANSGQKTIPLKTTSRSVDGWRLEFALDQKEDNVEIVSQNVGLGTVTIYGISLSSID